jgi:hypothetical protein
MFDGLLDNFYILIPIAVIIYRIVSSSKKNKAGSKHQEVQAEPARPEVLPEEDIPAPAKKAAPKPKAAVKAAPRPQKKEAPQIALSTDIPQAKPAPTAETSAQKAAAKKRFPETLEYLPPLKRAVILSEVLGSPKGLN